MGATLTLLEGPIKLTPISRTGAAATSPAAFSRARFCSELSKVTGTDGCGVPGRERFVVDGLNARFSGEFDVNRAA